MNSDFEYPSVAPAVKPLPPPVSPEETDLFEMPSDQHGMWTQKPYRNTGKETTIERMDKNNNMFDEGDQKREELFIEESIQGFADHGCNTGKIVLEFDRDRWTEIVKYSTQKEKEDEMWAIQLVGVKTFCASTLEDTINFIRTEQIIQDEFKKYFEALDKIYSGLRGNNIGYLPLKRVRRNTLGVLDLGDRGFHRVIILDAHEFKDRMKPLVAVYLVDYNTTRFVHPKCLMYATTFCTQKRSQTNDFFLARLSEYRILTQFRSALKDFVEEHGRVFTAKLVTVTPSDVAILELYHEKFTDPISDVLKMMTIQRLIPEELPALGDVRAAAHVIHAEANGTVFFQFTSHEFELYRAEINSVSVEAYYDVLTQGPREIDETKKDLIYLTEYCDDGFCYRVRILKFSSNAEEDDTVEVEFIDFGNTETVYKKSLVPCVVLNKYLPHFPPQAVKARLINTEYMNMRCFRRLISEDLMVGVETLKSPKQEECALVEIIAFQDIHQNLVHVSRYLNSHKKKFVQTWPEVIMKATTKDNITFHSLESINMNGAVWRDQNAKEVELGYGVMIDVYIAQTNTPGDFTIQPYGFLNILRTLETDLHTWYKGWSCANDLDPHVWLDVRRDCIFCSVYMNALERRVRVRLAENPFLPGHYMRVLLLDYGRYLDIYKPELSSISIDACKVPAMGAQGILKRVADPKFKRKKWSTQELLAFRARVKGKRFMFKISGFERDEAECLKLTGDLYERCSTSSATKSKSGKAIDQSGKPIEGLRKLTMRELTHANPKRTATATVPKTGIAHPDNLRKK